MNKAKQRLCVPDATEAAVCAQSSLKLLHVLEECDSTDIIIKTPDGDGVAAHKCIMACASEMLKARLYGACKGEMLESFSDGKHVVFTEFPQEDVQAMVDFIYGRNIEITSSNFIRLLKLAGFFVVNELLVVLESALPKIVNASTLNDLMDNLHHFTVSMKAMFEKKVRDNMSEFWPLLKKRGNEEDMRLLIRLLEESHLSVSRAAQALERERKTIFYCVGDTRHPDLDVAISNDYTVVWRDRCASRNGAQVNWPCAYIENRARSGRVFWEVRMPNAIATTAVSVGMAQLSSGTADVCDSSNALCYYAYAGLVYRASVSRNVPGVAAELYSLTLCFDLDTRQMWMLPTVLSKLPKGVSVPTSPATPRSAQQHSSSAGASNTSATSTAPGTRLVTTTAANMRVRHIRDSCGAGGSTFANPVEWPSIREGREDAETGDFDLDVSDESYVEDEAVMGSGAGAKNQSVSNASVSGLPNFVELSVPHDPLPPGVYHFVVEIGSNLDSLGDKGLVIIREVQEAKTIATLQKLVPSSSSPTHTSSSQGASNTRATRV